MRMMRIIAIAVVAAATLGTRTNGNGGTRRCSQLTYEILVVKQALSAH